MIIPDTRQPTEPALCSRCLVMWRSRWSLINWERGPRERKLCISPSSSMSSPPSDCTINRLYSLKLPPQDLYPSSKFLSNLEARQRSQKERIIRGRRRRRNEGGGSLQHTYITSILKLPHMSQSPSILNLHLPWRGVVQLKAMVYNFITLAANYTFRPLLYTWIHRQYTHRVPFPLQSGKNTPQIHHPCN